MGNLKKFEKVWASNTSFADVAIKSPSNVELIEVSNTPIVAVPHLMPVKSAKNTAKATGTKALMIPNKIAPDIFARTRIPKLIGASNSLSNERPLLSNVIVTASMEVVPNNMLIAIRPGNNSFISTFCDERMYCMSVHEIGKMIPQLMFGGLR